MRLSGVTWVGVALQVAALACVVVALVKADATGIEGAYFTRSVDAPAGGTLYAALDTFDPRPWLVAALVLLVAGIAAVLAGPRRSRR